MAMLAEKRIPSEYVPLISGFLFGPRPPFDDDYYCSINPSIYDQHNTCCHGECVNHESAYVFAGRYFIPAKTSWRERFFGVREHCGIPMEKLIRVSRFNCSVCKRVADYIAYPNHQLVYGRCLCCGKIEVLEDGFDYFYD
jgi:hypothetical protein